MRGSVTRRQALWAAGGVASAALLTACGQNSAGPKPTVAVEPTSTVTPVLKSPMRLAAETYALGILKRPTTSDSWREAKQRLAFAFALCGESDRVVLGDGQGIEALLGNHSYPDSLRSLTDLNRRLYISAAMGEIQTLAPEQASLLTQLVSQGTMREQNTLLLNSLVLILSLKKSGLYDPPSGLMEEILRQATQNQSDKGKGWGYLSGGQPAYTMPSVDNNVLAVLAGISPRTLLDFGRRERGWSHFVDDGDDPTNVSVVSTALAGWVTPWSPSTLEFISSLQNSDGGFPSYPGDGQSNPVATAEVLTLLAAPANPVFGSFVAKTS